jgi:hypothetical protein
VRQNGSVNPLDADAEEVPSVRAGSVTLVDGRSFVMSDTVGDIDGGISGLIYADNRFLSRLVMRIEGQSLESLSAGTVNPFQAVWASRFRVGVTADAPRVSSGLVIRRRFLLVGLREEFEIRNLSPQPLSLTVRVTIAADFAHIFEVKAGAARTNRPFVHDGDAIVAASDDGELAVRVTAGPLPAQLTPESGDMVWHFDCRRAAPKSLN